MGYSALFRLLMKHFTLFYALLTIEQEVEE